MQFSIAMQQLGSTQPNFNGIDLAPFLVRHDLITNGRKDTQPSGNSARSSSFSLALYRLTLRTSGATESVRQACKAGSRYDVTRRHAQKSIAPRMA